MSRKPVVLITGAGGEIGHGLIQKLQLMGRPMITLDLVPIAGDLAGLVRQHYTGSILDKQILDRILTEYEIDLIFHLAAVLSTRGEFAPIIAHQVNVEGTLNMLEFAQHQGESHGRSVTFLYPSSIAVYGFANLQEKNRAGKVCEELYNHPITMYGCNKLYGEQLGNYYCNYYKQLAALESSMRVDFRGLRFPGLISAQTLPSGGTSDYAPEMIHAAAMGKSYDCFVRDNSKIPFMAMPDAIDSLLQLASVPRKDLSRVVYNVGAFAPSVEQMKKLIFEEFPLAQIGTKIDEKRQRIIDSWPEDVDDSAARNDWGHAPRYDLNSAFRDYLFPKIKERYHGTK